MRLNRRLALFLPGILLLTSIPSPFLSAQELSGEAVAAALEKSFVTAIEKAEPSVVAISRLRRNEVVSPLFDDRANAPFPMARPQGAVSDDPDNPDFVPRDFGSGVIIAVDPQEADERRAYILTNGRVLAEGTPQQLINSEQVRSAYLGSMFRGDEFDEPADAHTEEHADA